MPPVQETKPSGQHPPAEQLIIGSSKELRRVIASAKRVAPHECAVLIVGPTGTGKENLALLVHQTSKRLGDFVPVNCANLNEQMAEAELFGHARGAFTGAIAPRIGLVEVANGGTLFLDEIGELPLTVQAKLLRTLQERASRRMGENEERSVDVRVVAATNRDLEAMVEEGTFRRDLYERLADYVLYLPPLAARGTDVIAIARHFLETDAVCVGKNFHLGSDAKDVLCAHDWPGNVRELRRVLRKVVIDGCGKRIRGRHIRAALGWDDHREPPPDAGARLLRVIEGRRSASASDLRSSAKLSHSDLHRRLERLIGEGAVVCERGASSVKYARAPAQKVSMAVADVQERNDPATASVLRLASQLVEIKRQDLVTQLGMAERSASRLLGLMEEKGLLEKCGAGKFQRYRLPHTVQLRAR